MVIKLQNYKIYCFCESCWAWVGFGGLSSESSRKKGLPKWNNCKKWGRGGPNL